MDKESMRRHRDFLKDSLRKQVDFSRTDQRRGVPPPPLEKPFDPSSRRFPLLAPETWRGLIPSCDLTEAVARRESRRRYSDTPLTMAELSFLLWSTQGVREVLGASVALRTVPSAGARHAFETYLFVMKAEDLDTGLYRFLPMENELLHLRAVPEAETELAFATFGQDFVGSAAVVFVWAAVPYRMEWRYGLCAHRVILLDAGHVCQNLYLACEAIGAGTCAVAAYDQDAMDSIVGLDGEEEFVVYMAPVGKLPLPGDGR